MSKEQVTINTHPESVTVVSDYNSEFPPRARRLGGKWAGSSWVFDARDEAAVRALCMDVFGTDGTDTNYVDVRVTLLGGHYAPKAPIEICGRTVARATGRDSGAKLGDGVIVEEGGFTSSGSAKNWATEVNSSGAVVLLRDMSRTAVMRFENSADVQVETVGDCNDSEALASERVLLLLRLTEIDALLTAG